MPIHWAPNQAVWNGMIQQERLANSCMMERLRQCSLIWDKGDVDTDPYISTKSAIPNTTMSDGKVAYPILEFPLFPTSSIN